ncbi:helix-turn-helix domain-containing protein [Enterobacter sp. UPMP2060]
MMKTPIPVSNLKPTEYIQDILNILEINYPVKNAPAKTRFKAIKNGKPMCFFLFSGSCVVSRAEDTLVISTLNAPNIIGINEIIPFKLDFIIEASTDIKYLQVPLDEFLTFTEANLLWKSVSFVLMYVSSRLYENLRNYTGLSTYKIICNQLYALNNESFDVRATTPAVVYIQRRTFLSRSGIMKILSDLNAGGYISINKGLLIKINMLPEKY